MARAKRTEGKKDAFWTVQASERQGLAASALAVLASEVAGLGYWRHDIATGATTTCEGMRRMLGIAPGSLRDLEKAVAAVHPDDIGRARDLLRRAVKFGEDYATHVRMARPDGSWRVFSAKTVCRRDEQGAVASLLGVVMDVTETTFHRVLEDKGNDFIIHSDMTETFTYVSPSVKSATGYTAEEIVGRRVTDFVDSEDRASLQAPMGSVVRHSEPVGQFVEYRIRHKDGRVMWLESRPTPLRIPGCAAAIGTTGIVRDVTARKLTEARLERALQQALHLAQRDSLTGLANRGVFLEALEKEVEIARHSGRPCAVLYLDLDHFKDVNDTMGHSVGNALLKAVSNRLRANTRLTDTIARFGGDEFAVLAPDLQGQDEMSRLAETLISVLGEPYLIDGKEIHSFVSIGIDFFGAMENDAETLLSHADLALYQAKSEGRGTYRYFTLAMDAQARTRVTLGADLQKAIVGEQLFLVYQPQIALDAGQMIGVEALVRWRHPERGILGPDVFIPLAEQMGFIGELGEWVLFEACRQARSWLDTGRQPMRMAVNLSALQFKAQVGLEETILRALSASGLPAELLELELTETVLMGASREHGDMLRRLRQRGVTIAIDDFGTGYSSLDYLRRFPVDRIKIAQIFIDQVETAPADAAIVRATLALARDLGIQVIAEGVETRGQADLLRKWDCDEAQGYYFARPLPGPDVTLLLPRQTVGLPRAAAG